ncbi:hypothetical protein LTR84_008919 [Exophiala bonariae]|uniref:Transcription factor domain-containing protein n=1 Tax=Exophiala bonariae TaxID=1690606 RepID=A0AAV9MZ61_9EURO|nr:hypothetical protein LTR84_008919 [Exophiala bonariae]
MAIIAIEYTDDHFVEFDHSNKLDSKHISLVRRQIWREKRSKIKVPTPGRFRWTQPLMSVVNKGNSDPFNVLPVKITPSVNKAISFLRDSFVPSLYLTPFFGRCSEGDTAKTASLERSSFISYQLVKRTWDTICLGLCDEVTAATSLTTGLALITRTMPGATKQDRVSLLEMQTEAYRLVRSKLEKGEIVKNENEKMKFVLQLYWLFRADCVLGNIATAIKHGKMLQYFLRETNVAMDHTFISYLIGSDTEIAAKTMQRTVLDIDYWIPSLFAPHWPLWESLLPEVSSGYIEAVDSVINTEPLLGLFYRSRRLLAIAEHPKCKVKDPASAEALVLYTWTRGVVDLGHFINHYMDLATLLETAGGEESLGEIGSQASISLAALCMMRWIAHTATINGVDLRDASGTIISHLQQRMEQVQSVCSPEELKRYERAYLWIFFIGALYYQKKNKIDQWPVKSWFHERLRSHARAMNIVAWPDLRQVLQNFVYSDHVEPNGALWIGKTLELTLSDPLIGKTFPAVGQSCGHQSEIVLR